VRYFKSKQYNWSGISQQPSLLAKAKRGLLQFTPYSWDSFEWGVFSSPKRCLQASGGCRARQGVGLRLVPAPVLVAPVRLLPAMLGCVRY
jgi:phosphatidylserine synthase 2